MTVPLTVEPVPPVVLNEEILLIFGVCCISFAVEEGIEEPVVVTAFRAIAAGELKDDEFVDDECNVDEKLEEELEDDAVISPFDEIISGFPVVAIKDADAEGEVF